MKAKILLAALAISSAAHASADNRWWVLEPEGGCTSLRALFDGTETPDEVYAVLSKGGGGPKVRHVNKNMTVFVDPGHHYPPMIMIRGWDNCKRGERAFEDARW
ncbi:hypothetical protein [Paraburkholderia phenoliruptrix]|uniref:hypothetical protein n=1 Tax=Paraburkholderia phenoliruptrix TaxID=252970 RepID=UPI0034D00AC2